MKSFAATCFFIQVFLAALCLSNSSDDRSDEPETAPSQKVQAGMPSDPQITPEAAALYRNLKQFVGQGVLFGHQETLAYGVNWKGHEFDSDIYKVCGDFPSVFGWDLGEGSSEDLNIDEVPFDQMRTWIRRVYEKNGINTISWHMRNPATGNHCWDTTAAVERILPGGDLHSQYLAALNRAAAFLNIQGPKGEPIPIILRFFHEHNGHWFWWSAKSCSVEQFIQLWRFTVDYFRQEKQMHQFLYCYSPDAVKTYKEYLERYPGDDYVDVLGMDNYRLFKTARTHSSAVGNLEILADLAAEKGKIAALTETGANLIPDPTWFTQVLLRALQANEKTRQIVWVCLWRNGNPKHFFAPYPGHRSEENFIQFYEDPFTVFLSDLPAMYR